ncbi:glycosyltransferase [Thermomonospora catenispora]|uniref:glycosyltransferase n=1 Tax=Thermomonospora catenispora TaxID=2493090 RepID=UPI001124400E|nr:glycosyltransferase [Thermomonospora catenispora]TNY36781.1 glycosyltransferase family 2 protein [Thermomonospora catenispora]
MTAQAVDPATADGTGAQDVPLRVLQRVVMPIDRDLDVLKLYVDGRGGRGPEATADAAESAAGERRRGPGGALGRRSLTVPPGRRVSLCTYFNAFPAGYWRRWTEVSQVTLRARISGEAMLIVYRSSAKGHSQRVASLSVDDSTPRELTVELSLEPFIDGGWYWFDIVAGGREVVLESAEWCAATERPRGTTSIGITTYNRPDFCVGQLEKLVQFPEVLEVIDEVFVIDQGTDRVSDHPRFAAAAEALGDRLTVITQGNLGGSGGFARCMAETLDAGRSDYVLLLDDDVVTEPEGILRAVTFADLCRTPTLVGGHMFSLYARSVLHSYGETVEPYRWFWGAAPNTRPGHDFAREPLWSTPWLHRRVDVDYNAWWMCLIPVEVIRQIGLAMPFFIKWDDAEYGLRARSAGFPTVTLPGAAVWHMPFHDKDDTIDWQAYYHERNRLVSALVHSPYERAGNLLKESLYITVKHALAMQYSAAELMLQAMTDVLEGPEHMHRQIVGKLAELRAFRARFPDAQAKSRIDHFPPVRREKPPKKGRGVRVPKGRRAMYAHAAGAAVKQLLPVKEFARRFPQTAVPHMDQRWWLLTQFDSALVSSADGTKVAWYQRDPSRFRSLIRRTLALHARLAKEWPRLAEDYRAAMGEVTSPDRWKRTFEASVRERQ